MEIFLALLSKQIANHIQSSINIGALCAKLTVIGQTFFEVISLFTTLINLSFKMFDFTLVLHHETIWENFRQDWHSVISLRCKIVLKLNPVHLKDHHLWQRHQIRDFICLYLRCCVFGAFFDTVIDFRIVVSLFPSCINIFFILDVKQDALHFLLGPVLFNLIVLTVTKHIGDSATEACRNFIVFTLIAITQAFFLCLIFHFLIIVQLKARSTVLKGRSFTIWINSGRIRLFLVNLILLLLNLRLLNGLVNVRNTTDKSLIEFTDVTLLANLNLVSIIIDYGTENGTWVRIFINS